MLQKSTRPALSGLGPMNVVGVLGFLVVDTAWALFNTPRVAVAARALVQALHHSVTMACGAFISCIVTAGCWLFVVAQTCNPSTWEIEVGGPESSRLSAL